MKCVWVLGRSCLLFRGLDFLDGGKRKWQKFGIKNRRDKTLLLLPPPQTTRRTPAHTRSGHHPTRTAAYYLAVSQDARRLLSVRSLARGVVNTQRNLGGTWPFLLVKAPFSFRSRHRSGDDDPVPAAGEQAGPDEVELLHKLNAA